MQDQLESLAQGWVVTIDKAPIGYAVTLTRRGSLGATHVYTGTRLDHVVARAWAGEPSNIRY